MADSIGDGPGVVNAHDEWSPLEEVIVGTARHARLPYNDAGLNAVEPGTRHILPDPDHRGFPARVIEEAETDIAGFVALMRSRGIIVRRPDPIACDRALVTPLWSADYYFQYPPRDIMLTVGDLIIESPGPFRSRQFETWAYRRILNDYAERGARWISAPRPMLTDALYTVDARGEPALAEIEPVFDAANILRMGRDIIYLVSGTGNVAGGRWLQRILGPGYRVHLCPGLYSGAHIDTTIALLRPGLVLINPDRLDRAQLPPPLRGWDVIECPPMVDRAYSDLVPTATAWMGMNLLMLAPDLAVVDADQTPLIRALERHGINCAPLPIRHGRVLGGGFHCITVDVRRTGGRVDYSG